MLEIRERVEVECDEFLGKKTWIWQKKNFLDNRTINQLIFLCVFFYVTTTRVRMVLEDGNIWKVKITSLFTTCVSRKILFLKDTRETLFGSCIICLKINSNAHSSQQLSIIELYRLTYFTTRIVIKFQFDEESMTFSLLIETSSLRIEKSKFFAHSAA